MKAVQIKICGITSPRDAAACAALGADYLGLIFARGPRSVSVARAREIRRAVPESALVGVFVDAPIPEIVDVSAACRLALVQLHGHESPTYCNDLRTRSRIPIIKAFRHGEITAASNLVRFAAAGYVLLDLAKGAVPTAAQLDEFWDLAARLVAEEVPLFLAGSLTVANIRQAITTVMPFAVDVARGVESAPGVKDLGAVEQFIAEVKGWAARRAQ